MRPAPWLSVMLLVLLLAAGLRFHRLGAQSLWYDEGVAWGHATRSLSELVPRLQNNVHVPVYFAALGIWEDLAGDSEFALRSLSAFASVLGVAWTYALGMRLFHPLAGVTAAAFVALNSFSVYYAQETRMYAMLTAIAACAMWLFARQLRRLGKGASRHERRDIVLLGVVNALGMYTHVAYALVLLSQGVVWLWRLATVASAFRRGAFLNFIGAFGLTGLLFLPWLPTSLRQVFAQPNIAQPIALDLLLRRMTQNLTLGDAVEATPYVTVALVVLLLAGLRPRRGLWRMILPLCLALLSIALYLALGLGERYLRFLLPAGIAMALWLGRGCWILWSFKPIAKAFPLHFLLKIAALALAFAMLLAQWISLPKLYHDAAFQRDDLRGLTRRIESALGEDDAVIVSAAGLEEALRYYYRADAPVYGLPTSADGVETRRQVRDIIAAHSQIHVIFYGSVEQDPEGIVEATLNAETFEIGDDWVGDLRYARYATATDLPLPMLLARRFGRDIVLRSVALNEGAHAAGDVILARFVWRTDLPLETRYKVFLQLLDGDGRLVAQRDSEPGGGLRSTTSWQVGADVIDNHGLRLPAELPRGDYVLIAGLYDLRDPMARLAVDGADYVELARIQVAESDS